MPRLQDPANASLRPLPNLIFTSRWLQLPLYLGLILAQGVYVYHFWVELVHLIDAAFGSETALEQLIESIGYQLPPRRDAAGTIAGHAAPQLNETVIMLVVLALIDVVMISNLLIMVIVGGYETFVSRMNLEGHPDQPEWLSHVNASVLKVKLATAIIGISSIHLLKTFINAAQLLREGADVADHHPHHVPAVGDGDRDDRPAAWPEPRTTTDGGRAIQREPAARRLGERDQQRRYPDSAALCGSTSTAATTPSSAETSEPPSTPSLSWVS